MAGDPQVPWWDPGADTSVSPETDHVIVDGVRIARGSRVRMRPGSRRTDAQDLFLVGREAVVEAVLHDVDGHLHLAVTPADDPAADLNRQHGRFLYFAPDEVEPIAAAPPEIVNESRPEEEATMIMSWLLKPPPWPNRWQGRPPRAAWAGRSVA